MIRRSYPSFWSKLVILAVSLLGPQIASGATNDSRVVCDQIQTDHCSMSLLVGEKAVFSGQLLSVRLAVSLGQKAQYCDARLELEVGKVTRTFQIDLELEKRKHVIDNQANDQKVKLLQKAVEKAAHRLWFERPWFVATVTAVAVVASIFGVGKLLSFLPPRN